MCLSVCVREPGAGGAALEFGGVRGALHSLCQTLSQLPAGDPTVCVLQPRGAWGWQVSLRGCLCPGALAAAGVLLAPHALPTCGWDCRRLLRWGGGLCVCPLLLLSLWLGRKTETMSQPWCDFKLKIPGEMPVLAPGPLHGQAGGGGLGPSDPKAQGSPRPLCRWGWDPRVGARCGREGGSALN